MHMVNIQIEIEFRVIIEVNQINFGRNFRVNGSASLKLGKNIMEIQVSRIPGSIFKIKICDTMINTFANLSKSLRRLVYLSSSLWLEACQFEDSKYPKGLQLPVLEIFGFRLAIFKDFSLHLESIFRNYNVPSLWPLKNLPLDLYKERLCQREDSHIPSS